MNEGKGLMFQIALSYKKGMISKKIVKEICRENNWVCIFDKSVIMYPNITRKKMR